MFQQSLCILRRPWCSLFCSHNEGSFVDFFNFLNVFFRAKVYFFYPQDLNSGIKFLAIPFTQERGSKIHLSAQCLLYQLKSRQEQPTSEMVIESTTYYTCVMPNFSQGWVPGMSDASRTPLSTSTAKKSQTGVSKLRLRRRRMAAKSFSAILEAKLLYRLLSSTKILKQLILIPV